MSGLLILAKGESVFVGIANIGRLKMVKPRGRAASAIRTGLFIKAYFLGKQVTLGIIKSPIFGKSEACQSEIHAALKERYREENQLRKRRGECPLNPCTRENFGKYFRHLVTLGLVDFTGREEPIEFPPPGVTLLSIRGDEVKPSQRRFYRLTALGEAELLAWEDPRHNLP